MSVLKGILADFELRVTLEMARYSYSIVQCHLLLNHYIFSINLKNEMPMEKAG